MHGEKTTAASATNKSVSKALQKVKATIGTLPQVHTKPELLLHPNIPAPMHGVAPRVILGKVWWEHTRQEAYQATHYHCAACGVYKLAAQFRQWLEAHEVYRIDYAKGRMIYTGTVALCHCCHNYIHSGRLQALLQQGKVSHTKYAAIMQHGDRVLLQAGLTRPDPYTGPTAPWRKWRLVLRGRLYSGIYKSEAHWLMAIGNV